MHLKPASVLWKVGLADLRGKMTFEALLGRLINASLEVVETIKMKKALRIEIQSLYGNSS